MVFFEYAGNLVPVATNEGSIFCCKPFQGLSSAAKIGLMPTAEISKCQFKSLRMLLNAYDAQV